MNKVLLCYEDYSEMATTQTVLKKVGFDVLSLSTEYALPEQMLSFRPDIVIGCGRGNKVSTIGVGRRLKEMIRWTGKVILIFPPGVRPDPLDLMRVRMDMALEAPVDITRLLQILASLTNQDVNILLERMVRAVAEESDVQMRSGQSGDKNKDSFYVSGSGSDNPANQFAGHSQKENQGSTIAKGAGSADRGGIVGGGAGGFGSPSGNESSPADAPAGPVPRPSEPLQTPPLSKKYEKFLQNPVDTTKSSLNRKAVKRAQKDLKADWSEEALKEQDELRREFTDALFKKKND